MSDRYVFDGKAGAFTAQAFRSGLLSMLGHSPRFAVRDYSGEVRLGAGGLADFHVELIVVADSLSLIDRVSDADRREIENRMRDEVLDSRTFPEIAYRADRLADPPPRITEGRRRFRISGPLSLRGASRPHPIDVELTLLDDALQLRGETSVRLSDHHIRPVVALAGAIRLRDDVRLTFDLTAAREPA